jgi:hypothetical protein
MRVDDAGTGQLGRARRQGRNTGRGRRTAQLQERPPAGVVLLAGVWIRREVGERVAFVRVRRVWHEAGYTQRLRAMGWGVLPRQLGALRRDLPLLLLDAVEVLADLLLLAAHQPFQHLQALREHRDMISIRARGVRVHSHPFSKHHRQAIWLALATMRCG